MSADDEIPFWPKSRTYLVGYGKPPVHTRFRKGQSPNPAGRPKKKVAAPVVDRSVRDEDLAFMEGKMAVQKAGKVEKMSVRAALRQKQAALAMGGNTLALKNILERDERNRKDLAAEQAEDHRFWEDYIAKYKALADDAQRCGEVMPEHWPHPEDLVFSQGRFGYNRYGPDPREVSANLLRFVRLREFGFLHADWERRQRPAARPVSAAELLPIVINDLLLPKRMRLSEDQIFYHMYKISILRKKELKRQIETACVEFGIRQYPWKITEPAKLVLSRPKTR